MSIELTITEDIARAALLAAVDAQGADHVNPSGRGGACRWTYRDGSHCIVGEALSILGVRVPYSSKLNEKNVNGLDGHISIKGANVTLTYEAVQLLQAVQWDADNFERWGEALERHGVTR